MFFNDKENNKKDFKIKTCFSMIKKKNKKDFKIIINEINTN